MRADIIDGGTYPAYQLTDHTKTRRRLSELRGRRSLILVLSRALLREGPPATPQAGGDPVGDRGRLHRILGPAVDRRPPGRPARGQARDPARLGSRHGRRGMPASAQASSTTRTSIRGHRPDATAARSRRPPTGREPRLAAAQSSSFVAPWAQSVEKDPFVEKKQIVDTVHLARSSRRRRCRICLDAIASPFRAVARASSMAEPAPASARASPHGYATRLRASRIGVSVGRVVKVVYGALRFALRVRAMRSA
jgi:hypothetical protein